jgi:hypothetical protein
VVAGWDDSGLNLCVVKILIVTHNCAHSEIS